MNKTCLSFDDILLPPKPSIVRSRSEIDLSTKLCGVKLKTPLISANMSSVTGPEFAIKFSQLGGLPVLHRMDSTENIIKNVYEVLLNTSRDSYIGFSVGYKNWKDICAELLNNSPLNSFADRLICFLDVAHADSILTLEFLVEFADLYPDRKLVIGNFAVVSDEMYDTLFHLYHTKKFKNVAIKYGIGGGCFIAESKIKTKTGYKNINEVEIGEEVLTHKNRYKKVINKFEYSNKPNKLKINKNLICTPNHEFYVVKKEFMNILTDENIHEYAEWIPAEKLNKDEYFLLKSLLHNYELVEIESIDFFSDSEPVYDLTVEEDHSYTVDNFCVHNSNCTTRTVTGFGMPTFQSLLSGLVYYDGEYQSYDMIADGGIKNSGDIVKSLAVGAKAVMIGSLFAGCEETPERTIRLNDKLYKSYRGSASYIDKKNRGESGYVEGIERLVPYSGDLEKTFKTLCDGIRSGISYGGCSNVEDFIGKFVDEYMIVTPNGTIENGPHGLRNSHGT